jgi:3-oxoacyl-(acyl-carrier-protein) synthase
MEDGSAMAACMREALGDARTAPEQVGHVYAHGTGTQYNDRCEARALNAVLPHGPTVSATKSQVGHTIGAGGAIDMVLAVHGFASSEVVPCRNLDAPDPECAIVPARSPKKADPAHGSAVLVNSFAFGGHNAVLVVLPA